MSCIINVCLFKTNTGVVHAHLQGYQNIDRESSIEIMRFKKEGGGDSFPIEIEIQRESYVIFNLWKKRK